MDELDFLRGHELTVYTSHGCPDCTRLERWMKTHGVEHKQVYIDDEPGAAEKLESETGKQAVPFILVDGRTWVRGYHREERSRLSESVLVAELRAVLST
jgi:glutaredoxin